MKKLLFITALGLIGFTSCEKEDLKTELELRSQSAQSDGKYNNEELNDDSEYKDSEVNLPEFDYAK